MWASEAKGINVESLPKWEEKDIFKYVFSMSCRKAV